MRTVPEWIARHDDQAIPERVKLRILRRESYVCFLSKAIIVDGDSVEFHHRIALRDGGEHRESNIFPVLRKYHRLETAWQALARAEVDRKAKRAFGIHKSRNPLPCGRSSKWKKKVSGEVVPRFT